MACAICLWPAPASAQRLNLDGPIAPELGVASVLSETGERLARERDSAQTHASATQDPSLASAFRFRGAVRDLASALVGLGPENGRFGWTGALGGLRLADAMPTIDAIAAEASDALAAGHRAVQGGNADPNTIARWEQSRAAMEVITRRCTTLAARIRDGDTSLATTEALDVAVAHALGELRALVPDADAIEPAWPPRDPISWEGSVESAATVVAGMTVDPSIAEAASAAFDALRAGESAPEVRRQRRAGAWRIVDAIRATDVLARSQVTPSVTPGVVSACRAIATPELREVGESWIEEIAALGTLCERAMDLNADGVSTVGIREAMGVLAIGLSLPIDDRTRVDPRTLGIIRATTAMVEEALRAPRGAALDFRDGKFNRAWRALVRKHESVEQSAFDVCARMARAPNLLGTPEVASAVNALAGSTDTLIRVAAVTDWIGELRAGSTTGVVGPTRAGAADRLTVIRRGIGYDEHRDAALAELAVWERMRPIVLEMPAETRVRDNDPRISPTVRSRGTALVRIMDLVRAEWMSAWARADEIASIEATERIELLRRLGIAIEQVAELTDEDLSARVSRWTGFLVTTGALAEIRARAESVVSEAVTAAVDAQYPRLAELLSEWDGSCAGARVIAALGSISASRPDWPDQEGASNLIATVGVPPPPDAWMLDRRDDFAAVSVWLAELEATTARNDRGMADAIVIWINHLAEPVLGGIAPQRSQSTQRGAGG